MKIWIEYFFSISFFLLFFYGFLFYGSIFMFFVAIFLMNLFFSVVIFFLVFGWSSFFFQLCGSFGHPSFIFKIIFFLRWSFFQKDVIMLLHIWIKQKNHNSMFEQLFNLKLYYKLINHNTISIFFPN